MREARAGAGHLGHAPGGLGHCACAQEALSTSISSCAFPGWRPCLPLASRTRFLGQLCPGNAKVLETVIFLSTSLAGPFCMSHRLAIAKEVIVLAIWLSLLDKKTIFEEV